MKKTTITLAVIVMIFFSTFGISVLHATSYGFEANYNSLFDYNNDGSINTMDLARVKHEFMSGNTSVTQNDIAELKEFLFGNWRPKLIEPPLYSEAISSSCSCYDLTKCEKSEATDVVLKFTEDIFAGDYNVTIDNITDNAVTIVAKSDTDWKFLVVQKIEEHTTEDLVFYVNDEFLLLNSFEYGAVVLVK